MTTPIVGTITANMATALAAITTVNGYNFTAAVERFDHRGNTPAHAKIVLHKLNRFKVENETRTMVGWRQRYEVVGYVAQTEATVTSIEVLAEQMSADIEKAVMADPTRGGNAVDTFIMDPSEVVANDGGIIGVNVAVEVYYRTAIADPYTAA